MTQANFTETLKSAIDECRKLDGPLALRLHCMAEAVRLANPGFAELVDRMVNRWLEVGAGVAAPNVGDDMPDFVMPDQKGHLVALDDLLQQGSAVIAFHRGHWCPYCQINAHALTSLHPEIQRFGGRLAMITPNLQRYNARLCEDVPFPVLSDLDNGYALECNLVVRVSDEWRTAMLETGRDLVEYQGNSAWMLPIPATFIVAGDRKIVGRVVDPDYRNRMATADILAALRR